MAIEVELRGRISEKQYNETIALLDIKSDSKEIDDLQADFFIIDGLNLKVAHHTAQNYAKIALKSGEVSSLANTEIEVPINTNDVHKCIEMFKILGFNKVIHANQKRINYQYLGTQISMKWSKNWQYHFEIEICVDTENQVEHAKQKLLHVLDDLQLQAMNEQEIGEHVAKVLEHELPSHQSEEV